MRVLLWVATLMVALWSGYWFVGKSWVESGVASFLENAPAQGLTITHEGYGVAGYPNRFDLTVTEPRVTDRISETRWEAPFLQLFSLSYRPWHVIAAFAPEQTIRTPAEDLTLTAGKLQGSLVVTPGSALALDRSTLVGESLTLASSLGWTVATETLRLGLRADPSRTHAYDIGLELLNLRPDPSVAARLPDLPPEITLARLDANATLTGPLDQFAGVTRPQITSLSLREGLVTWGYLSLAARGDLQAVNGYPEGRIQIRVTGWRNLVTLATSMGMIRANMAPMVESMMQAIAGSSDDPDTLEMPLIFREGQMLLGPLPLGPAPSLGIGPEGLN